MLEPAISLVLTKLKEIRDSQERRPRVSRDTLVRFVESRLQGSQLAPGKSELLELLNSRVSSCTKCPHLARSRTQTVFGVGNPDAELMFIGEAPGADEDARGEPFVGRAGQLLTRIIETMGLTRGDVYIANILKCRPDMPDGISGNRPPTPDEMQTCISYLLRNPMLSEKRKVWEDMLAVLEHLEKPISEKQRKYFLSASD